MIDAVKLRILQGDPIIHDVKNARLRSIPPCVAENKPCPAGCDKCEKAYRVNAVTTDPVKIDLNLLPFLPLL